MSANDKTAEDAMKWLLGAGLAAILLSAFVFWSDQALHNSDGEERLKQTLIELRGAQHGLNGGDVDERLKVGTLQHD